MKIFISSVIVGFELFRDAVEEAAQALGHEVIRAENFAATDSSSRIACLRGVREADLIVLLLGERYGTALPPKGISPTHEEFLEAKNEKPILVFKQSGVSAEAAQISFIELVEAWDEGHHRRAFADADELKREVLRAIHEYELRSASMPVDAVAMERQAVQLLEPSTAGWTQSTNASIRLAIVGGPATQILRPRELESPDLEERLANSLLFGDHRLFDRSLGMETSRRGGTISLSQPDGRLFSLSENGNLLLSMPAISRSGGIPCVLIEDVEDILLRALGLAAHTLEAIDSAGKLSRVVVAARVSDMDYVAWRTRAEHAASPNTVTHNLFGNAQPEAITLSPPDMARAALRYDRQAIAVDLTALLQRQATGGH